jgi:serine/threonine protein kinase
MARPRNFSLEELAEATSNWAAGNILGDGGFAVVFLGRFGSQRAAVKRVRSPDDERERKFLRNSILAELAIISNYNHQNVCALIGSYVDEQKPDAICCLVYELCVNGNLLERLGCRDHKKRQVPALTGDQRLVIALGICRALEYLHVKALPPVVHRDIKSPNILLDANLNAKVADFGTVRQDELKGNSTHIKTQTVIGTCCYMPSEVIIRSKFNLVLVCDLSSPRLISRAVYIRWRSECPN